MRKLWLKFRWYILGVTPLLLFFVYRLFLNASQEASERAAIEWNQKKRVEVLKKGLEQAERKRQVSQDKIVEMKRKIDEIDSQVNAKNNEVNNETSFEDLESAFRELGF